MQEGHSRTTQLINTTKETIGWIIASFFFAGAITVMVQLEGIKPSEWPQGGKLNRKELNVFINVLILGYITSFVQIFRKFLSLIKILIKNS